MSVLGQRGDGVRGPAERRQPVGQPRRGGVSVRGADVRTAGCPPRRSARRPGPPGRPPRRCRSPSAGRPPRSPRAAPWAAARSARPSRRTESRSGSRIRLDVVAGLGDQRDQRGARASAVGAVRQGRRSASARDARPPPARTALRSGVRPAAVSARASSAGRTTSVPSSSSALELDLGVDLGGVDPGRHRCPGSSGPASGRRGAGWCASGRPRPAPGRSSTGGRGVALVRSHTRPDFSHVCAGVPRVIGRRPATGLGWSDGHRRRAYVHRLRRGAGGAATTSIDFGHTERVGSGHPGRPSVSTPARSWWAAGGTASRRCSA